VGSFETLGIDPLWALGATLLVIGVFAFAFLRGRSPGRAPLAGAPGTAVLEPAKRKPRAEIRPPSDVLVRLRGVAREYPSPEGKPIIALRDVDLDVRRGEALGIIGPSGLGKSTLLNILAGIDFPTRGEVRYAGVKLPSSEADELRRHRAERVSIVFQDLNLISHLSALENAALPLLCRGVKRAEALAQARSNLERLGLGELLRRLPSQLSGGQKQRVAIARAFTSRAPLILADEPTGSLDPETAREVMDAFAELAREHGTTWVVVTHDPRLARRYCDRVLACTALGLEPVEERPPGAGGKPPPGERALRSARTRGPILEKGVEGAR